MNGCPHCGELHEGPCEVIFDALVKSVTDLVSVVGNALSQPQVLTEVDTRTIWQQGQLLLEKIKME